MEMYGIVVWAKFEAGSAIVWCSDNKRLAYVTQDIACDAGPHRPKTGDLVRFTCRDEGRLRYCTSVEVVEENFNADLKKQLCENAANAMKGFAMRGSAKEVSEKLDRELNKVKVAVTENPAPAANDTTRPQKTSTQRQFFSIVGGQNRRSEA